MKIGAASGILDLGDVHEFLSVLSTVTLRFGLSFVYEMCT
jgi:hypothetical protein